MPGQTPKSLQEHNSLSFSSHLIAPQQASRIIPERAFMLDESYNINPPTTPPTTAPRTPSFCATLVAFAPAALELVLFAVELDEEPVAAALNFSAPAVMGICDLLVQFRYITLHRRVVQKRPSYTRSQHYRIMPPSPFLPQSHHPISNSSKFQAEIQKENQQTYLIPCRSRHRTLLRVALRNPLLRRH